MWFTLFSWLSSALASTPAMVTTTHGEVVLLAADGESSAAPAAPFLLKDGVRLKLGSGAQVVLLYGGTAKRLVGPTTTSVSEVEGGKAVQGAGASGSVLDELLNVHHSQAQAGAHRGGLLMVRPVPGGDLLNLGEIRWRCEGCGEQTVTVVDFLEDETVWTGKGTGSVRYGGPALTADTYQIGIGDEHFTIYLAGEGKRKMLDKVKLAAAEPIATLEADGDKVGATSVFTGLYSLIGLQSDALYLVDERIEKEPSEKGYTELRDALEARAFPK